MSTVLELDDRRRASFGKIGRKQDSRYRVTTFDDGRIILEPVVDLTARELEVLADTALIERLRAGVADAKAGNVVPLTEEMLRSLEGDD